MLASLAGCGEDGPKCGAGTENVDGVCTGVQCTNGTILVDDHCEIDPNSCQDGTVLMGDKCVDPATQAATIEEATEPNGLGLGGEVSNVPAGEIVLKPVGDHFTIHGTIAPFQDTDANGQKDADFDSYVLDVTGPTMISVTADGLHGLAGGFLALANVTSTDPLSAWTRFGVNPMGDTAKRQLYLPAAGTYIIAIADTRSLFLTGAAPGAAEGQAPMEYYVTVDQVTATPTTLTPTNGVATSTGQLAPGEVKLFTVAMGEGINDASLGVTIDHVQESLVISRTRANALSIRNVSDGDAGDGALATAEMLGFRTTDTTIIAVDSVFDYANGPYNYDLNIKVRGAGALSTTGTPVAQPSDSVEFSTFYYDVGVDGLITGMNIAFDRPVAGAIVDENFLIFSRFSYNGSGFGSTFTSYKGLLRHTTVGRYYFLVFDPNAGTTDITATSSYAAVPAVPVTKGTPLANQTTNTFGTNPFTYSASVATAPWQIFNATGTGTGAMTASYFKTTASGRLDPLVLTPACAACADTTAAPIFTHSYAEAGTPTGRILLDDGTTNYFVTVRPATGGTFGLDFKDQVFTDLGTAAIGTPVAKMDQALDATTHVQRYLVRTTAGNGLTTTVTPEQGTLDTRITPLSKTETAGTPINNGAAGAVDTWLLLQGASGWTAFTVTNPNAAVAGGQFDLDVSATAPKTYTQSAGTTAYADACTGGAAVALSDNDEGASTATINTPAGFDFFGFAAPQLRVFSNGFLSFDTTLACASVGGSCFYGNVDIPTAANPNSLVAPYWDDLEGVAVCQKTVGTKLIIQWQGLLFQSTTVVAMQAILDGSNDTIEFVYAGTNAATGATGTIGLENQSGTAGSKVGFNTAAAVAPKLFTPM